MQANAIIALAKWLMENEFAEIMAIKPLEEVDHYCITTAAPLGDGPEINHTYTVAENDRVVKIWFGTDTSKMPDNILFER